ncbi:MAG: protein-L-isoaspartate O-methyltransferase [Spirochaetales bacterium]|nr:protein-L-isoaspartate O-methyltransferase [Spirochaetales bacterium]
MPCCPSCGLDVKKPGLCAECAGDTNKENAGITKIAKTRKSVHKNIIFLLISHTLMAVIGLLVGYLLFHSQSSKRKDLLEANAGENKEWSENVLIPLGEDVPRYDITNRAILPAMVNKEEFVKYMLANTNEKQRFIDWRWDCVQDLLQWRSIRDERIKEAFLRTPRENFIRKRNLNRAYEHAYMPIGYGATITDPWIVSLMTQTIAPQPYHKVLEIGTGSGYQSALLSELSNFVFTIEIIEELAAETNQLYQEYVKNYPEYGNIRRVTGDGYYGWPEKEPFDRIIVTCSIDHIPPPLLKQLAPEGIMVIPVGPPSGQQLLKVTKHVDEDGIYFDRENLLPRTVHFISFRDQKGERHSTNDDKPEMNTQDGNGDTSEDEMNTPPEDTDSSY